LPGLRAFVRLRLGDRLRSRESSQDIAQSVCREALTDLDRFEYRGPHSFRNWLYLHAERKIRDRGRFWGRERRDMDREHGRGAEKDELEAQIRTFFTPSRDAAAREELERVEQAFRQLPEDYRRVIILVRVLGLPHREAASELGRTELATRTLLSRALARLALLVEDRR